MVMVVEVYVSIGGLRAGLWGLRMDFGAYLAVFRKAWISRCDRDGSNVPQEKVAR